MNKTQRQFAKASKRYGVYKFTPRASVATESRWKKEGASATKGLTR